MPENSTIFRPGPLRGRIRVPGDKSISHRALIAGAAATRPLRIANLNPGRDVRATSEALAALGSRIQREAGNVIVAGTGLRAPDGTLDCMNSGSTARMVLGACAGANVAARFDGDDSLRRRPMEPVAAQLRAFGAIIETTQGGLPVRISGTPQVQTRHFILLGPSAQVKSALLFAGVFAGVQVRVDGDRGSRDHTERLLRHLGAEIEWNAKSVDLRRSGLTEESIEVVGDFSAAAFFITAAAVTPRSSLIVEGVGVNPTRTGLLEVLRDMGAGVEMKRPRIVCGEPVADVIVEHRALRAANVNAGVALRAIDEIPLVAIAAAFAQGTTGIAGVADLRTKESDRIAGIERLLGAVGVETAYERGVLRIVGSDPRARRQAVEASGDHRIAMAAAVLACATGPLGIDSGESLDVSYPGFADAMQALQQA